MQDKKERTDGVHMVPRICRRERGGPHGRGRREAAGCLPEAVIRRCKNRFRPCGGAASGRAGVRRPGYPQPSRPAFRLPGGRFLADSGTGGFRLGGAEEALSALHFLRTGRRRVRIPVWHPLQDRRKSEAGGGFLPHRGGAGALESLPPARGSAAGGLVRPPCRGLSRAGYQQHPHGSGALYPGGKAGLERSDLCSALAGRARLHRL